MVKNLFKLFALIIFVVSIGSYTYVSSQQEIAHSDSEMLAIPRVELTVLCENNPFPSKTSDSSTVDDTTQPNIAFAGSKSGRVFRPEMLKEVQAPNDTFQASLDRICKQLDLQNESKNKK